VPGIGPRAADRLVAARRQAVLRGLDDLRRLGVDANRAAWFLALRGRRLARRPAGEQLRLFAPGGHLPAVVWNTPVPPCAYR
jgi:predicted DNA-binding helix-hairpin-helix protein